MNKDYLIEMDDRLTVKGARMIQMDNLSYTNVLLELETDENLYFIANDTNGNAVQVSFTRDRDDDDAFHIYTRLPSSEENDWSLLDTFTIDPARKLA